MRRSYLAASESCVTVNCKLAQVRQHNNCRETWNSVSHAPRIRLDNYPDQMVGHPSPNHSGLIGEKKVESKPVHMHEQNRKTIDDYLVTDQVVVRFLEQWIVVEHKLLMI